MLIAYLLLTHLGATSPDAQADRRNDDRPLRLPSIPKLQQNLRLKLWQDAIQSMETGVRYRQVAKKIKTLIML